MRVRNVPVWALLFCIPVALSALNCGSVDLGANQNDTNVVMTDDLKQVVGNEIAAKDDTLNNDINLEDGATDEWRGRGGWGRGWGRGWGYGGGWGGGWGGWGYGSSWPYYGYSYWPYSYTGWYW